ncbi:MAG: lysoplasmalogenase [Bifidobacteriaceae bacterium]|nr:lysoplasmalogenase [Bifidobacteriaceae bacterium]
MTVTFLGAAVVVPNTAVRVKGPCVRALLLKAACGLLFVLAGAAATAELPPARLPLGLAVVLGLVFGLVGDIWLDLAEISPASHDTLFFAGMAAFGVGHLFFIGGMLWAWRPAGSAVLGAAAAAAAVPALVLALSRRLGLDFGRFRPAAAGYGYLLALTAATGLFTAFAGDGVNDQALAMGVGGVLFLISDLALSGAAFGAARGRASAQIACYVFYYAAQFTMALSLLAAR